MISRPHFHLRVLRGAPDEVELAALMLALTVLAQNLEAAGGRREGRTGRAHWDRPRIGGFHPCHSWRSRPHR
ncbi:acyl-CoA carboxylase subunit epsilon [Streptomyces sp. NPDC089919]|uniref:acyl-CoA carboxylase subunit epsilon n=1 Tax=Streptomyces sp. NPDC089919 TaxID=3155188 RepID=UPI00341ACA68